MGLYAPSIFQPERLSKDGYHLSNTALTSSEDRMPGYLKAAIPMCLCTRARADAGSFCPTHVPHTHSIRVNCTSVLSSRIDSVGKMHLEKISIQNEELVSRDRLEAVEQLCSV